MGNTHLSEQERLQQLRVTLVHEGREPLLQGSEGLQQLRATPVARALCFAAGVVTRLLGSSSKAPTANVYPGPGWPSPSLSSLNIPTDLVFFSPAPSYTM